MESEKYRSDTKHAWFCVIGKQKRRRVTWGACALAGLFFVRPTCRADEIKPRPSPAQEEFSKGEQALREGHLTEAEVSFLESLRLDPNSVNGLLGLADVRLRKGDSAGAGTYLRKALELNPKDPTAQTDWGHYLFFRKRYDEALKAFDVAIQANPKLARPYLEKGDVYFLGLNRPRDAIDAYRKGMEIDASQPRYHYSLANALARTGDRSAAEAEFREAVQRAPKDPTMLQALAVFYETHRQFDQALATYSEALAVQPAFFPANLGRGDILLATGQPDKAIAEYQTALKVSPKLADTYYKIGIAYERESRIEEANQAFLAAIKANEKHVGAYNELAWLAASRSENLNQALTWASKAVTLAPRNANLLDTLAWVYRARRENDKAIATLQKSLRLDAKNPEALYHLGVLYQEDGELARARSDFSAALAISGEFSDAPDARTRLAALTQSEAIHP